MLQLGMIEDRTLLRAALRVLAGLEYRTASASDIDLLRNSALPDEIDLDLDDLARTVAQRMMAAPLTVRRVGQGRADSLSPLSLPQPTEQRTPCDG
jgi:hypothetical protein